MPAVTGDCTLSKRFLDFVVFKNVRSAFYKPHLSEVSSKSRKLYSSESLFMQGIFGKMSGNFERKFGGNLYFPV